MRILVLLTVVVLCVAACGGSNSTPDTATEGAIGAESSEGGDGASPDESGEPGEAQDQSESEPAAAEVDSAGEVATADTDDAVSAEGEAGAEASESEASGGAAEEEAAAGDEAENVASDGDYGPGEPTSIYDDLGIWMCHPDKAVAEDVCRDADKSATLLTADGTTTVEPFADNDSPIDCLYYYPTTSEDATYNSDLVAGTEVGTTVSQTSRLGEVCNVHAPLYRSITLSALFGGVEGDRTEARDLAFGDIVAAWNHYLKNSDPDRGVVLIGHSQGAGFIRQLIQDQIDNNPAARDRMIAAYILGSTVTVPDGEVVGADFENVPVCTDADEVGCVISYASYQDIDAPGPEGGIFARAEGGEQAVCVSPAALLGEQADSVFDTTLALRATDPAPDIDTTWTRMPSFLDTRCVEEGDFNYLEISVRDDSPIEDPNLAFQPGWGLHIHDVQVEYANIARLIERQGAAFNAG